MRPGVKHLLLQMLNTCFGGRGPFTKAQCSPNYFKDQGLNNWAGTTQTCAISPLLPQSINGGKLSGPGLYWGHGRNLCSWCFPEPLLSWFCCLRCQQDTSRSVLFFLHHPKLSDGAALALTVDQNQCPGERLMSHSCRDNSVSPCSQAVWAGFGKVLSPSYIHITFLAHSSSFINQLGLKVCWLWGRSFPSYHCLGAVESLSPLQKSQSNTRGKQDNSLKPGSHDLESSSANTICSPSADVMPSTQSQPSRGKVSHLGSVHHWPFHFLFHTDAKKGILYILSQSETKEERRMHFSDMSQLFHFQSVFKWGLMLWQWNPWCDTTPGTMGHGQGGEICCYGHFQDSFHLGWAISPRNEKHFGILVQVS